MASRSPSFVRRYQLPIFFILAYAFSWIVWGSEIAQQNKLLSFHIPDTFAYWGLTLAVLIVAGLAGGKAALWDLLQRIFRSRVGIQWYALALLVPLLQALIPAGIYRLFGGNVPLGAHMSPAGAAIYFVTFGLVVWVTEELAWRGFALPRLQAGRSALTASLILGLLWGLWHTPLFLIAGTAQSTWPYLGFVLFTVAYSVLMTWMYNHTRGSVLLASLFHIASDTVLAFSGVLSGDPLLFWLTVAVTCIGAIVVVVVEGPARLSRERASDADARVAPEYQEYVYSQA